MDESARITESESELVELTADIVSAYVSNNTVVPTDLPKLIGDTFGSLAQAAARANETKDELTPAVSIKRSVTPEAIVCLECGRKFKSLKRHIGAEHDLAPKEYREKWSLSQDYPMVAPSYTAARSKMAKQMGLGRKAKSS
jgi:predicted transcriptional regulator